MNKNLEEVLDKEKILENFEMTFPDEYHDHALEYIEILSCQEDEDKVETIYANGRKVVVFKNGLRKE